MTDALAQLSEAGVSIWLDDLSRELLRSGDLQRLLDTKSVVGDAGRIISLEHFGASADYKTIFREFGITADAVAAAARESISEAGRDVRPGGEQQTSAPTTAGTGDRPA